MNCWEMDIHHIHSIFPYFLTENFLDFFDGLAYIDQNNFISTSNHDQQNTYCSLMHMNSYKYGSLCPSYTYEINDNGSVFNYNGLLPNDEEALSVELNSSLRDEEHAQSHNRPGNSHEAPISAVTKNRGLPEEVILSLPILKFKRWFFLRKRSRSERCVICQMGYKRGERQMNLPCRHLYHAACISRWLGINRACPICLTEVCAEERSAHEGGTE